VKIIEGESYRGARERAGDSATEEEMTPAAEPAYVAAVLMLYTDLTAAP
jgi:hypothetical protein